MEYPVYWTYAEWTEGFRRLLDFLQLDEVGLHAVADELMTWMRSAILHATKL